MINRQKVFFIKLIRLFNSGPLIIFNPSPTNSNSRFCSMRNCQPKFNFSLHSSLRLIAHSRFIGLFRLLTNMLSLFLLHHSILKFSIFIFSDIYLHFFHYIALNSAFCQIFYISHHSEIRLVFRQFVCMCEQIHRSFFFYSTTLGKTVTVSLHQIAEKIIIE